MQRALDRVHARLQSGASHTGLAALLQARQGAKATRLTVRADTGWVALRTDAITRLSAADKYVLIACGKEQHAVRGSLRSLLARLEPEQFVQVHRSHVVNVHAVEKLEPWTHGDGLLLLTGGESIVLSRNYRRAFLERFGRPAAARR
jgi:two-component system LytT family response regulator